MDIEGSEDIKISQENILGKRRRHLEAACGKMGIKPDSNVSRYWSMDPLLRPRLLFSDQYKVILYIVTSQKHILVKKRNEDMQLQTYNKCCPNFFVNDSNCSILIT